MDDSTLEPLAERIRAGDVAALGEFLDVRRAKLLNFLRVVTGEHLQRILEIDDLFQEVSAAAIEALPRIPKADLDIDAWLEQLARRRVVDAHRKYFGAAKRADGRQQIFSQIGGGGEDQSPIEQLLIASMTSPSRAVSRDMRIGRLRAALSQLSPDQQQLIELRFGQGLSSGQIAERLGKSDVGVRVALSRTVKELETLLRERTSP